MEAIAIAGATVLVKGLADITISQIKEYIKRRQEIKRENPEENLGTKTR